MKERLTLNARSRRTAVWLLCAVLALAASPAASYGQKKKSKSKKPLRPIRVAVFDLGILKGVDVEPKAVTDQVVTLLSTLDKVTLVDREAVDSAKLVTDALAATVGVSLQQTTPGQGAAIIRGQVSELSKENEALRQEFEEAYGEAFE